jgi:hypothetical protein
MHSNAIDEVRSGVSTAAADADVAAAAPATIAHRSLLPTATASL